MYPYVKEIVLHIVVRLLGVLRDINKPCRFNNRDC